jgi:hypothetical protein
MHAVDEDPGLPIEQFEQFALERRLAEGHARQMRPVDRLDSGRQVAVFDRELRHASGLPVSLTVQAQEPRPGKC